MDVHGPTRFRPQKSPPAKRFLSAFPHASPPSPREPTAADADLHEDDIFTTDISEPLDRYHHHHLDHHRNRNHHNSNNNYNNNNVKTNISENFGILAALPESPTCRYHKASVSSSSSSSSSRAIPGIPKPPPPQQQQERFGKLQIQSAPVNIPVLAKAMRNRRKVDDLDDDEGGGGEMVLPPHEIVARARTPVVSCSVLEGAGRTLKGRDLCQVRNAVFRKTGFLG